MKQPWFQILAAGVIAAGVAQTAAAGLRLECAWSLTSGERAYLTTGTNQRGLAYNPLTGHLILVNRSGGISVHVLDALNGDDLGAMDTSGLTNPGTFILSKVGVAEDGVIYAANFGTIGSATPAFTVYRWESETSASTIAYADDPGAGNNQQWGTTFDVRGAGTNTQILVSSSAGTIAALLTTVDGTNFTSRVITTDLLPGQMGIAIAFGAGNTFWAKSVDGPLVQLTFDAAAGTAATLHNFSLTNFPGTLAPMGVDAAHGLLAGIDVTTPDTVALYSISNLAVSPALLHHTNLPSDTANSLSMGAVEFGGGRVYTLDSNNGLQAYDLVASIDPVPPMLVYQPRAQSVFAGATAELVSAADGSSPLRYQWQTNGVDVLNGTNAVLRIPNVQAGHEADYSVVVTNAAGSVLSATVHLTVLPPGVMTPLWSLAPGSRSYLTSSGNNQRGLAYNPATRHLVLVNRAGSLSMNLLDAATGADRGTMNVAGITNGTFVLNMVGVAEDGAIYAANFGTYNGTTTITTVYRWASETAPPTIAFQGDPTGGVQSRQWGNTLDVRGSGTNTQILLPSGNQQYVALLTTTNGINFSSVLFSDLPTGAVYEGAAFGAGNTFWGKSSTAVGANVSLAHFGLDFDTHTVAVLETFDPTQFDAPVYPIAVDAAHSLLAGVAVATPDTINLYDLSQVSATQGPVLLQTVKAPADNANTLWRGAVDFGDGMLFALDTNNGISAFVLPFLTVNRVSGKVVVSWPATLSGFRLESRPGVGAGSWTPVPGAAVVDGRYTISPPAAAAPQFFRLKK